MSDETVLSQAMAAMRCLGIEPTLLQTEEQVEEALDRIKRTTLEDWRMSKEFSRRRNREWTNKARIIGALLDSVLTEFFRHADLEMSEMRASELKPGMFVRGIFDKGVTCVVLDIEEHGTQFDKSMRIELVPCNACDGGSLGTSGFIRSGQIISAAVGVSEIINRPMRTEADGNS